jgi:hypothetical protein
MGRIATGRAAQEYGAFLLHVEVGRHAGAPSPGAGYRETRAIGVQPSLTVAITGRQTFFEPGIDEKSVMRVLP